MTYQWGIIGTGVIANEMAAALRESGRTIYGVTSGKIEHAQAFAERHHVQQVFTTYEGLLADAKVDVVYIATPHNLHYQMIRQALLAGKHVFCEKAITVNAHQLEECVALAKERNLVLSDGVTLFHMPLYKKLAYIVASGKLGAVKMIQVNFGSCKEYDVTNRFFSKELAGGALLDIGVYAVSFARFFMTSKPNVVLTTANYFETGVDETSGILLKNDVGEMAVIALTMRAKQPKRGVIACEKGFIEITNYPRAEKATITYTDTGKVETVTSGDTTKALQYEIQDMEDYLTNQSGEDNLTMIRDVMDTLTSIRSQWGLVYPFE
ncbi:Gfo/Idh/MocA family protein [Enterococcus camelliae]|uniref:Gfo/Idh/MocA family protein n=1 Tax=Enterococcus camelliae TaxID=453959 RepID=A0ABW5TH79_9ENTE